MGERNESLSQESYPLPVIKEETIHAFLANVDEKGPEAVIKDAATSLMGNNLELFRWLDIYLEDEDELVKSRAYDVIVMTHELLRLQAEAEDLEAEFNLYK